MTQHEIPEDAAEAWIHDWMASIALIRGREIGLTPRSPLIPRSLSTRLLTGDPEKLFRLVTHSAPDKCA